METERRGRGRTLRWCRGAALKGCSLCSHLHRAFTICTQRRPAALSSFARQLGDFRGVALHSHSIFATMTTATRAAAGGNHFPARCLSPVYSPFRRHSRTRFLFYRRREADVTFPPLSLSFPPSTSRRNEGEILFSQSVY